MILGILVPLVSLPKADDRKSLGTNNESADHDHGVINQDPTFFPARELRPSSYVPSGQEAAPVSSQNRSSSPYAVTIPMEGAVQEPVETAATTTRGSTENCPCKLGKIFAVQAFVAALALMTFQFQPHGSSPALSSSMLTMVEATVLFGLTFTVIGLMLQKACLAVATVSIHAGSISAALGFFFMMAVFVPGRFVWLLWATAGVLSTVYVYSLAKPSCNTNSPAPFSLSNC
ncbi:hypothetical protein RHMOL_Rhmol06G0261500 [Rhododendron molle]|uniref:Uncharacterized protein n=1 Tax=Rhododendron molle TaxID=49168 RepID=A0ACC0NHU3_RHOML|nr:hypothetical protein RHMOL_Rhmol06G0261500 [Rhododendron molle]